MSSNETNTPSTLVKRPRNCRMKNYNQMKQKLLMMILM